MSLPAYGPPTVNDIATDLFVTFPTMSTIGVICIVLIGWQIATGLVQAVADTLNYVAEVIGRRWPHLATPELRRHLERERRTAHRTAVLHDRTKLQLAALMTLLRVARR